MSHEVRIEEIPRVIAVLVAENNEYLHVDRLAYVASSDLAIYYLREALRDFTSLKNKQKWESQLAREEAERIKMSKVEEELDYIASLKNATEVRKAVSLIAAKALAIAQHLAPVEQGVQPSQAASQAGSSSRDQHPMVQQEARETAIGGQTHSVEKARPRDARGELREIVDKIRGGKQG